jgi:hypothetical protein
MTAMIPPLICLFDDGFTSDSEPTALKKYTLVRLFTGSDGLVELQAVPDIPPQLTLYPGPVVGDTFLVNPIHIPSRWYVNLQMWPTGDTVSRGDEECIPVMDIGHRMLRASLYVSHQIAAEGDTIIALRRRQHRQKRSRDYHMFIRSSGQTRLTPATERPRPQPPVEPPPRFVAELVKAAAIKEGQSCPISMIPIEHKTHFAMTSCFHLFDPASLDTWRLRKDSCPVCKKAITSITII